MLDAKKTLKDRTREYILHLIRERNLKPGDRLPPQREISQILKVSQKIPEIVLNELEAEHLVVRRGGCGTFLAGSPEGLPGEKTESGRNVYLLLPTLRNPYFAEHAANAELALLSRKKSLRIITGEAMPNAREIIAEMVREGTAGIIAYYCPQGVRNFAFRHKVPLVEFRNHPRPGRYPAEAKCVIADLRAAALLLGEHLLSLGHRDIYLAGDLPGGVRDFRFEVLTSLLESRGCRVRYLPQKEAIASYPSYEAIGAELAERMLGEGLPATAGIFFNTSRAVGAMRFLIQKGIRIPEDFSIAGFDKPCQSGFPEPVIAATMHEQEMEMAVSLLFSSRADMRIITIDPCFRPGTSTAPPRVRRCLP